MRKLLAVAFAVRFVGLVAAAVFVTARPASALVLGPVEYSGTISIDYSTSDSTPPVSQSTSFTGNNLLQGGSQSTTVGSGTAQANSTVTPVPTLSLTATAAARFDFNDGGGSAGGNITMVYQFAVVGPTGSVPIDIIASGSDSANYVDAQANFGVGTSLSAGNLLGVAINRSLSGGSPWSLNTVVQLQANTIYYVDLNVVTMAVFQGGAGAGSATDTAEVDPMFTIDSSFANAGSYSLEFSPGIGATPLPASLPLFAAGLGGFGLLGWHRKRKNATTLAAA